MASLPNIEKSDMRHPILKDSRYTIAKEFCGQPEARFVVRFCGEWIGQSKFYSSAVMLAVGHNAQRHGALVIEAV